MKTVAYIDDRAVGVAALLPLACRDIVFKKSARMGDVRQIITGRNGQLEDLSDAQVKVLTKKAAFLARTKGHPEAVAQAMVDPEAEIVEARDQQTGAVRLMLREEAEADRARFQGVRLRKESGHNLTLTGDEAASFGLGQVVTNEEELKGLYGLRGKMIRVDGPGWVDSLVTVLTDPYVSWLLLFVGLFMLVIELKLPGIGLPAITSALAFLLFFWSHYLSGTADQLEIILFLVGMVCLAAGALRLSRLRRLRHDGHHAHARQHRDGQPHVRLADPGIRISRDGLYTAATHRRPRGGSGRRRGPGPLFSVNAAVQPPGPQARALDRARVRRPDGQAPLRRL